MGCKVKTMISTLKLDELCIYTSSQLNFFFPDNNKVELLKYKYLVDESLSRLEKCYKLVTLKQYNNGKDALFNHLYSDHYVMYLWFLSNTIFKNKGRCNLADKIYFLNKALHAFDCMYDTKLPDYFLLFHCSGTMLGKASYSNFFISLHGCTIGSHKGNYPIIGEGVSLTAHSSIIGKCEIGDNVSISNNTNIFEKDIPSNHIAFKNDSGHLVFKKVEKSYSSLFFNII